MVNLICQLTGEKYPATESRWRSETGGLLDLEYEYSFDPERVKDRGSWLMEIQGSDSFG